ncbi:MAG: Dam family site-specific DNA-(adenine-N6)-methyltransferase [Pyrinomonadaceae bacterium]|nr:Dam family site-specific DNA-(adenine-N6)-methyltransferase [Pyrinomonadaceae bacterium]
MSKIIVPPIKSQGIKTKLVPWIMEVAKVVNKKRWIEPFLGTGVVAFNSGFQEGILNDINPHIINFYRQVQNGEITPLKAKSFLEIEGRKLSEANEEGYEHFRYIRDRFNQDFDPLDLLFLSRAGFNGMMRFNSKGCWNIPFCKKPNRFNQSYITKIVNQIANVKNVITNKWEFKNKNFTEIISLADENDMLYCDPPYFGRYVDYYNGWTERDEEILFEMLSQTKANFILSTWHHNDWRENTMIKKLWNKFNIVTKDHFYHSGGNLENRKSIVEALICNFEIKRISQHNHEAANKKQSAQISLFQTFN